MVTLRQGFRIATIMGHFGAGPWRVFMAFFVGKGGKDGGGARTEETGRPGKADASY